MPRKPDPTLRPAIIAKVVQHLRGTKLEDVSVRSLGRVLGTSAYPIVYHFGSREALIDAVVEHLDGPLACAVLDPDADADALACWLVTVFGGLDDPDRALAARLAFELGSVESLDGRDHERRCQRDRTDAIAAWCSRHGWDQDAAEQAARGAVLAARGVQWGAIVDGDLAGADDALREIGAALTAGRRLTSV